MNCRESHKYLAAFADGELETETNLRLLDHLKMCPECAARVAESQAMRAAVRRAAAPPPPPVKLRNRILRAIRSRSHALQNSAAVQNTPQWLPKLMLPLAIAATIMLAVGFWHWAISSDSAPGMAYAPMVKVKLASDARQQHRDCTKMAAKHHRASLGRDRVEVLAKLTEELGFEVAGPDFSASGYEFLGADTCGIAGHRGAHLVYRSTSGERYLSLFSITAVSHLAEGGRGSDCITAEFPETRIVAWNGPRATYLLCGDESADLLCEISQAAR